MGEHVILLLNSPTAPRYPSYWGVPALLGSTGTIGEYRRLYSLGPGIGLSVQQALPESLSDSIGEQIRH